MNDAPRDDDRRQSPRLREVLTTHDRRVSRLEHDVYGHPTDTKTGLMRRVGTLEDVVTAINLKLAGLLVAVPALTIAGVKFVGGG